MSKSFSATLQFQLKINQSISQSIPKPSMITSSATLLASSPSHSLLFSTPPKPNLRTIPASAALRRGTRIHASASSAAAVMTDEQTLYDLLGIGETVTLPEIKEAYRRMARKHHPDVSPPDRITENTRRFILVQQAYETLSDPDARASYDRALMLSGCDFGDFPDVRRNRRRSGLGTEEEKRGWKVRWESQLEELMSARRGRGDSWGAGMREGRSLDPSSR